ncbi:MAG: hypothetical protein QXD69_07000, partial [Candidatus Bathyarchaeia archaeon]
RFIVEVSKYNFQEFESLMMGLPCSRIGFVKPNSSFIIHGLNGKIYEENIWELKKAWKSTFDW